MQMPRTLALLCLGASIATTASGFFYAACSARCGRAPRLQSRGGARSEVQVRAWELTGSRRNKSRYPSGRAVYSPRCVPPAVAAGGGDGGDDNYGSSDYSEYGYEPDYEMQGEDSSADDETLEKWRLERLLVNDRWQFSMYGKQNVGNWVGSWQEYVSQELRAGDDGDVGAMLGIVPGKRFVANTGVTRRVLKFADDVKVFEHGQGHREGEEAGELSCPEPVVETLFSDSFRGGNGTQIVGNAYTMAEVRSPVAGTDSDALGDVWVEVGLRVRDVRMRCVFQYGQGAEEGAASVRRVFLVREGLDRLPPENETSEPELYGSAGKGLYDAPPQSRSPLYFSIYAEGGLTIRFPLKVETGQGGVFSVDWTAGDMRYQADRVFDALDGSCRRLEVTQILTDDAEVFLPMEKF